MRRLNKPYITFAVPSYNSEPFLHVALESLRCFDDRIEVLVVNDGSTDKTAEVAETYAKKYPIIRLINQENKGHGGAINTALEQARGIYFKVLDSDDWVDPMVLKEVLSDLEKAEELSDIYLCDYSYWQQYEKVVTVVSFAKRLPQRKTIHLNEMKPLGMKENFTLHSTMFKAEVLRTSGVKLPEHCSYEDNYMVYAGLVYSKTIRYLHQSLYQYQVGRKGQSMSKANLLGRYGQIILTTELVFDFYDIMPLKKSNPKLFHLLLHHLNLIVTMVPFCCQNQGSKEARKAMKEFFSRVKEKNPAQLAEVMKQPIARWMRYRLFAIIAYPITRHVVRIN